MSASAAVCNGRFGAFGIVSVTLGPRRRWRKVCQKQEVKSNLGRDVPVPNSTDQRVGRGSNTNKPISRIKLKRQDRIDHENPVARRPAEEPPDRSRAFEVRNVLRVMGGHFALLEEITPFMLAREACRSEPALGDRH